MVLTRSKRRAVTNIDRISALPDSLICHILSFMGTEHAVKTSALSMRWKHIWKSVPVVDFDLFTINYNIGEDDDEDYEDYEKEGAAYAGLEAFVSRALDSHTSGLRTFRLKSHVLEYNCDLIGGWIEAAIGLNVVEIDLEFRGDFEGDQDFILPDCLFTCRTLEVLKLESVSIDFRYPSLTSSSFPRLKSLHINVDCREEDTDSYQGLFSHCPLLEVLTLDLREIGQEHFNICAPNLKILHISLCEGRPRNQRCTLSINAPKLKDLCLSETVLSHYSLENVESLVRANITVKYRDHQPVQHAFSNRVNALLGPTSIVKYLSLSILCVEAFDPPAFHNLIKLELALEGNKGHDWTLLAAFLKRSPILEDLVFKNEELTEHWEPPEAVPTCLLSHLKTISIRDFKGGQAEMEVAKYLLKNGKALNKMTIHAGKRLENELVMKFQMFQRGSTVCQVEFIM